uniref:Uncharacterized protein n=1 Tax=Siphoviridae sp. ctS1E53 TaxID=2826340 RepID=A0A8S5MEN0_9CAUD|nr:MAG TPA: hypothetical protein [Siphoviridae sp. ctS1E53]
MRGHERCSISHAQNSSLSAHNLPAPKSRKG